MKKINLIEWLSRNSHEKQSPQRFARYAAMLIMLLTLGVGQMWGATATTVYYAVPASNLKSGDNCYTVKCNVNRKGDGDDWAQYTMTLEDNTNDGKLIYKASFTDLYDGLGCLQFQLYNGESYVSQQQPISSWTGVSEYNGKMYVHDTGWTTKSTDATTTVYFVNTSSWTTPKAFAWSGCINNAAWSGQTMISTGKTLGGKTIYYINFNKRFENIIFSNNGSSQTADLTLGSTNAGKMYDDGEWKTYQFDITLDPESGSGGTSSVTGVVGSAMPGSKTAPTRSGYIFGGYYTGTGGSGTCYYDASMVSQTNVSASTPNTLYAKWTPVTWKLQSTRGDHGTFTGTGPYTLDVTYNSATMDWGAARFDLNGTSYICNNYTIGTSGKLDLRAVNAYTAITGMTNGKSYTFTITYENATWYVQIEEAADPCTTPTIAWNTTPANGVAGGNMTASVTTNQTSPTITWNSSNTSAATVSSSGVITYVAAGNTRITASYTGDGSTYCSTTASVYQDITVSAAVADAWSLWYWGGSETKIGDFTPDGGNSHHLDFELTASNFETLWLKNNSTQYVAPNINANTVTNVTVTEVPVGRFRDDATKGHYRFTIYKDGGGAWKLDASPIYRVTYNDNGATSGTAPTDAAGYASGATVTVKGNTGSLAKTGYDFGGWNLSADGSGTNYTAGSGTFSITANTELFAKWNVQSYTITYKDQGNVAFSGSHVDTPSAHPTTHTYGTATTLNYATKTGYTFGGWFDNPACTGVAVISLGATAYSNEITLYAKWTEVMSDLTTSCNYDAGDPGYAAPTKSKSSIGISTTATLTATTPSTGYTFAGWTLSDNLVVTSGDKDNDLSITVRTNGNGAAATAQANYNEDLSSSWYISGESTPFGGWGVSGIAMSKKTGHSTEEIYYCNVTATSLPADDNDFEFQTYNSSNSTYYGYNNYWITRVNYNTTVYIENSTNMRFRPDILGTYEFKLDNTGANPVLTVTFPTTYTVNFGVSPAAAADAPTNDLSISSGSSVLSGTEITFTQDPTPNPGYTWSHWEVGGESVGTGDTYTATIDAATTVTAVYTENSYSTNVAVSPASSGSISSPTPAAGKINVLHHTGTSVTATPNTNYIFDYWSVTDGGLTIVGEANANPGTFKATSTGGTITANFADQWAICGIPNFSTWNGLPLKSGTVYEGTIHLTAGNHTFKVVNRAADTWYTEPSKTITRAANTASATTTTGMDNNITITADKEGDYTFTFDTDSKSLTVTYPVDPTYTVSVTAGTHGSITTPAAPATTVSAGEFTPAAIEATADDGYVFSRWTVTSGDPEDVVIANNESASTTITATGAVTLTATFISTWAITGSSATFGEWSTTAFGFSNFGTNASSKDTCYIEFDLPANTNFTFKIYNHLGTGDKWYGNSTSSTNYMTYTANNDQPWEFHEGNSYKDCGLTTAGAGTYRFIWNITDEKLRVRFPESYTVTYGKVVDNGEDIGGVTVTGDDGATLESGKYVAKGSATFTAADAANYTFVGWRTSNTYGEGEQLSTENPYTMSSIEENKTVYAHYAENMTTVTLAHTGNGSIKIGEDVVTSTTAGVVTTRSITAVPDAGYYFAGWELSEDPDFSVSGTGEANSTITVTGGGAGETSGQTLTANFVKLEKIYFRNINETTGEKLWNKDNIYVYFNVDWIDNGGKACVSTSGGSYAQMNPLSADSHVFWAYVPRSFTTGGNGKVAFSDDWMDSEAYPTGPWDKFFGKNGVFRTDYNKHLNMYVPACTKKYTSNSTNYFDNGYWMKYNNRGGQDAGYYLKEGNKDSQVDIFEATADNSTLLVAQYRFQNTSNHTFWIANAAGKFYKASATVTNAACSNVSLIDDASTPAGFTVTPTSEGYYTFYIEQAGDTMKLNVVYPISAGDYQLVYTYDSGSKTIQSDVIKPDNASSTSVKKSVYIDPSKTGASYDNSLKLRKCSGLDASANPTWTTGVNISLDNFTQGKGVYEFDMSITDGTGNSSDVASVSLSNVKLYEGEYYIKTDYAPGGWVNFKQNAMEQNTINFDKTNSETFDYYFCKWVSNEQGGSRNVKCIIANEYNEQLTDTLIGDGILGEDNGKPRQYLAENANVRFSYNSYTNELKRAYINGSTAWQTSFLRISAGSADIIKGYHGNTWANNDTTFTDNNNWTYMLDLQAHEGARVKLTANYRFSDTDHEQYLIGKNGGGSYDNAYTEELLGGGGSTWQHLRVVYDFKTNHLLSAWLATGEELTSDKTLNTNIMVLRDNQDGARTIELGGHKITEVDTAYSVVHLTRGHLTNKRKVGGYTSDSTLTNSERQFYWVSFPYEVKISDIFGSVGTYGVDWILQSYDGKKRAREGYWLESSPNWKFMSKDETLNAFEGYVLTLDLSEFQYKSSSEPGKWGNNVVDLYLYFPSDASIENVTEKIDYDVPFANQSEYYCNINRSEEIGGNGEPLGDLYDRTKRDSYWHCIGIPSFAAYGGAKDASGRTISWIGANAGTISWENDELPFLYEWNKVTNELTPTSTSDFTFQPMVAYLVQYSGDKMTWSTVVAPSASSIVARRKASGTDIHFAEFNLELMNGEKSLDHTYIRMTDKEDVTADFEFGQDMCKEFQPGANIYTMIDQLEVAGNSLPLSDQMTVVPVGVKINEAGDYTFAMPEGTDGIGVVLIDNISGTRTNLGLTDYTVALGKGDYRDRFYLEISPVKQMPTGMDNVQGDNVQGTKVRKVMVDGILYIVKDGKIFDARGAKVK